MDVGTFNAAKVEIEQVFSTHMITRAEYHSELKELRKERQDDRHLLLVPVKQPEIEPVSIKQRPLYSIHEIKLYRSRRKQILFTGARSRRNSKASIRR